MHRQQQGGQEVKKKITTTHDISSVNQYFVFLILFLLSSL